MAYVPNELLSRLVGCRVNTVLFSFDYVQLRFDGESSTAQPFLNCDVLPVVTTGTTRLSSADTGWADALRALIGQKVTATHERTGTGLRIEFPHAALHLHPTVEELDGPEIAMLSGFEDGDWMVWRPGEDSFEDLEG